jgi:hypothetical protein
MPEDPKEKDLKAATLGELLAGIVKAKTGACPVCDKPAIVGLLTGKIYCLRDKTHWTRGEH